MSNVTWYDIKNFVRFDLPFMTTKAMLRIVRLLNPYKDERLANELYDLSNLYRTRPDS